MFLVFLNHLLFLKTSNTEFDEIILAFTDKKDRPLQIEYKVKLTMLIKK